MASMQKPDWKASDSILFAHIACLFMGVGMIFWSSAPGIVTRIVTGDAPSPSAIFFYSAACVLGLAFIGIHVLIRRGVLWSAWAAFITSAIIASAGLALITKNHSQLISSFIMLLSICTCFASWLAISTLSRKTPSKTCDVKPLKPNPKNGMFR